MPVVEQQPEPGRSSHGSPSELLSWLFFLIGLFKDPHFSLLLPPAARSKIDSLLQVKEPISPPLSLDAQSEWGGAKMFFLPVYHVCLCLLVGGGQKRATLKGLLHNNEFPSRHSRQVPTTLYQAAPKSCGNITSTALTMNGWKKGLVAKD